MNAKEILAVIRQRFGPPRYAFFPEFPPRGSGFEHRMDAFAVGLYPSTDPEWHGFEIKTSAEDLANELKRPWKADYWAQYCDRWWLVVSNASITNRCKIPETWGVMQILDGKKLGIIIDAPLLKPTPSRDLARAMIKAQNPDRVNAKLLQEIRNTAVMEGREHEAFLQSQEHHKMYQSVKALKQTVDNLRKVVPKSKLRKFIRLENEVAEAMEAVSPYEHSLPDKSDIEIFLGGGSIP